MEAKMRISSNKVENKTYIKIHGELTLKHLSQFKSELSAFCEAGHEHVIDLEEIKFIDSTGLGCLFLAKDKIEKVSGSLKIVNIPKHIKILFEVTRAYELLNIYDDISDFQQKEAA